MCSSDLGTGQLAGALRSDPRVRALEKQDLRTLDSQVAGPKFPFFVVDVSFVSLRHIVPALPRFLAENSEGVVLVKPQFEVGPDMVGSGGIVRDAAVRERAVGHVRLVCEENGFTVAGEIPSPVAGGDGNQEILLHLRWSGKHPSQGTPF